MRIKHSSITLILIQLFVFSAMVGALSPTVSATTNNANTTTSNPDFAELPATEDVDFDWFNSADNLEPEFVPGEILVKFRKSISTGLTNGIVTTGIASIDELNMRFEVKGVERILPRVYKLILPEDADTLSIVKEYEGDPNVKYAQPNYIYQLFAVPNDAEYYRQWAHEVTEAELAWNITTGDSGVVIAILDSGVDYNHPDLENNMWVNPGEDLNRNGKVDPSDFDGNDTDNNGYIDDIRGWDFIRNDSDPVDEYGHGTHCAGIAAAVANNGEGVAGVSWHSKIMPVRMYPEHPYSEKIAPAIGYAANNSADVISMSWGISIDDPIVHDELVNAYNKGVLLVAAVGNDGANVTLSPRYPAAYPEVIAVSATNAADDPWRMTNYGNWIDVAAPGDYIYSTYPTRYYPFDYPRPNNYTYQSGTSMAAPYVAGVAALIWSRSWVSPTGYSDPDGGWSSETNAYDDNEDTYATTAILYGDAWSKFLYLTYPAITCDKIRALNKYSTSVCYYDIDVYRNGAWVDVFDGYLTGSWDEISFTKGLVTQLRVRVKRVGGTAVYILRLYEADFWISTTNEEVRNQLLYTTDDLGDPGRDDYYGYGRVNARWAVDHTSPEDDLLAWGMETPRVLKPGTATTINGTILNFGKKSPTNLVFNGGFETGDSSHWVTGGAGDHVVTSEDSYGGAYSMLIGYKYSPNVANARDWCYQTITIPATVTNAQLSFYYHLFTEDYEPFDWFEVYVRDSSGNNLEQVFYKAGTKAGLEEFGWEQVTYDLSAYAGQTIQLYFAVANWYDTAYRTWCYIDDVSVTVPEVEEVQLLVNGSLVESKDITNIPSYGWATFDFSWTPTAEGHYNVTLYVARDDEFMNNNAVSVRVVVRDEEVVNVPQDFSKIQRAVSAVNPGYTIQVSSGTYYESVYIDKSLALIGEDPADTTIDFGNNTEFSWETVHVYGANNVNISRFTIQNGEPGVRIYGDYNLVSGNTISNNSMWGVTVWGYYNSISDNTIYDTWRGVSVDDYTSVSGNTIYDTSYGVYLYGRDCIISSNIISNNDHGVYLRHYYSYAQDNLVSGNTISNNKNGVTLADAYGNNIHHNNFINNTKQVYIDPFFSSKQNTWHDGYPSGGNYWSDYEERYPDAEELDGSGIWNTPYVIDENNQDNYPLIHPWGSIRNIDTDRIYLTIQKAIDAPETWDGHTIEVKAGTYYENVVVDKSLTIMGEDVSTTIIDGSGTGKVVTVQANNVRINQFTIQNGEYGIYLEYSNNTSLSGNTVSSNTYGIFLDCSSSNTVSNNVIDASNDLGVSITGSNNNIVSGNTAPSILAYDDSNNNIISGNTVLYNGHYFAGILLDSSNYNTIDDNTVLNFDVFFGIYLGNSIGNSVSDNTISNNTYGILLYEGNSNNIISGNTVSDNYYGMYIYYSSGNTIHHNNFINNYIHMYSPGSSNTWNSINLVGNYWDDYTGIDADGDGIGDTSLPHQGVDWYPLMWKWFPGDLDGDGDVDYDDLVIFSIAYGSQMGDANYNPIADLDYDGDVDAYDLFIFADNYGKHDC